MKSLLLISIVFPPEAGGGTIRAAKLAKYLPLFGWCPSVLTTTPPRDAAVVSLSMDHHIHVHRSYRCDVAEGVPRFDAVWRGPAAFFTASRSRRIQ